MNKDVKLIQEAYENIQNEGAFTDTLKDVAGKGLEKIGSGMEKIGGKLSQAGTKTRFKGYDVRDAWAKESPVKPADTEANFDSPEIEGMTKKVMQMPNQQAYEYLRTMKQMNGSGVVESIIDNIRKLDSKRFEELAGFIVQIVRSRPEFKG